MKKYIIPVIKVVELNLNESCLISQSNAQQYLKNDKWTWKDGHIYNPGGQDHCPDGPHASSIWNNEC